MANEHEEECFPPIEFILSTIQHEKLENIHETAVETRNGGEVTEEKQAVFCSNCLRHVSCLLCVRCIIDKGSVLEKQEALVALRSQRAKLLDAYHQRWMSDKQYAMGEQFSACLETKNQLECNRNRLLTLVRLKREAMERNMDRLNRLRSERQERSKVVARLQTSVDFMRKKTGNNSWAISTASLDRRCRDLATIRQRLVIDLLNNVFPLDAVSATTVPSGSSSLDEFDGGAGVMDILTDATLTTFQHDRWIFMGNSADVQYRLVHSCLAPDHGEYSMLKGWLFNEATSAASGGAVVGEVVTFSPPMTSSDSVISNRAALGTLSALAYCAQLVNVTARILDVRLPFSLTFSDFFIDKLKEAELDTAVVKLNANVAFLCCTQRMDYECVCFERPFWSLCNMSKNIKNLGYQSCFTVDARVARGFTNAEKHIVWLERATLMVVESADDWENINEQIPEWTGAASSPPNQFSQLITSATTSVAASFANLFKMHN